MIGQLFTINGKKDSMIRIGKISKLINAYDRPNQATTAVANYYRAKTLNFRWKIHSISMRGKILND